jgi:hypothetical protein
VLSVIVILDGTPEETGFRFVKNLPGRAQEEMYADGDLPKRARTSEQSLAETAFIGGLRSPPVAIFAAGRKRSSRIG